VLLWFFLYSSSMKLQPLKRTPVILALSVLAFVCGIRLLPPGFLPRWDFLEQLERATYDLRARAALNFPAPAATNLAFVSMEDSSIAAVKRDDFLNYHYGLYWPRLIYGRLIEELSAQGAKAVAFDVLFGERREDHPLVALPDGSYVESDEFFALQARQAGNVLIAATPGLTPPELFTTNTLAIGDVTTEKDSDGKLRRVKAYHLVRHWHPLFRAAAADPEIQVDLAQAQFKPGKIILPQTGATNLFEVPVDAENNFSLADFVGDKLPPGAPPKAKAFTDEPFWQMGIVLAAQELKLDLKTAVIDLPHGRITLHGAQGVERVIPVDADGYFYVDWRLTPDNPQITRAPIETLLRQDKHRRQGETNDLRDDFKGKLIVFGSAAQGNDLTDRGATPLESDTLLFSTYWNVANSVITGQFIHRTPLLADLGIICFLGLAVAFITWQMRTRIIYATLTVLGLVLAYGVVVFGVYIVWRWWLPLVYPVGGAMLIEHGLLVVYLVLIEEREKRRVKSVFSKMLSPDVVNELLAAENFSMVGSRREVTVLFADIRGFTTLTDEMQEDVVAYVLKNNLDPEAAEKCYDESARETLETVNLYLTKVADAVIAHGGTLDKYIGDCVMAFWGAPLADEKHALGCVRAALDAQRAIHDLNQTRLAENAAREAENQERLAAGLPSKRPLRALQLGTGINTGTVIVGLMGSGEHMQNYTIFGRDVNLASRLEGVSGSGRIIISETTHTHLLRHDPALAATCVELPSVTVKGIRIAVRIFEVPWRRPLGAA
jgi:class 3 adenylate cyclase/CHASE2 domain-containing sensor protein